MLGVLGEGGAHSASAVGKVTPIAKMGGFGKGVTGVPSGGGNRGPVGAADG